MAKLTLSQAVKSAQETLSEVERRGFARSCCAVLDHGGHQLAGLRDERSSAHCLSRKSVKADDPGVQARRIVQRRLDRESP